MIEELEQYYTENRISAKGFKCQYYKECKGECKKFSKAKEAMVGSEYEKHTIPRILFISLDPGSSSRRADKRTMKYQREGEIVEKVSDLGDRHRHWYQTCLLAYRILRRYKRDLSMLDIQAYFAHTNSTKCCQNNDGNRKAHERMFNNCKGYLKDEVAILDPDVIITQGDNAWDAVGDDLTDQEYEPGGRIFIHNRKKMKDAYINNGVLHMNDKEVLWFHSYHPIDAGCYWHQKRVCHKYWLKQS